MCAARLRNCSAEQIYFRVPVQTFAISYRGSIIMPCGRIESRKGLVQLRCVPDGMQSAVVGEGWLRSHGKKSPLNLLL